MRLIQELEELQTERGHLDEEVLRGLSARLRVPLYRLQELVSFYPHFRTESPPPTTVSVCRDVSCFLNGGGEVAARLREALAGADGVRVEEVSCLGCCELAPAARVNGRPVRCSAPAELAARLRVDARNGRDGAGGAATPARARKDAGGNAADAGGNADTGGNADAGGRAADAGSDRASGRRWESDPYPDPAVRYGALRALLESRDRSGAVDALIGALEESGLRGMGGAGFPTGRKWRLVRAEPATPKYVICNADESEPGTFKDRVILEELPHLVVEGMVLAGLAVGSSRGTIYLRHEYEAARAALEAELARARAAGVLGDDVLGSGAAFHIELFISPGGYILGEETALLEALEDRRGEPRNKPPFPGQAGLYGRPTLMNNVETFAFVPAIAVRGAEWWKTRGLGGHAGLKFMAVSGHVERPGVYEIPLGTTVADFIELAGGVSGGRALKAFAPGGASSHFLPAERADAAIDFDSLAEAGSMMGSGALVVVAEGTPMLPLAANVVRFFRNESCGKCVPCRDGTEKAVRMLERTLATGEPLDGGTLEKLELLLVETSICGLGYVALNPLLSAAEHWPDEVPVRAPARSPA